jgi:cytochrome c oxidase accessory protein FixG
MGQETVSVPTLHTQTPDKFRDQLASVTKDGRRIWMYPKNPRGRFARWRTWLTGLQLTIFFTLPFVKITEQPAVLLNVFERKFILFGHLFWPQDMYLFGLLFLTALTFLLFLTTTFGRIWCGWLCPQTLFMEMVFRKIEYYVEGDGPRRRQLDATPWHLGKLLRKIAKQTIFIAFSFTVSSFFAAYVVGMEKVWSVTTHPAEHIVAFTLLSAFTLIFYGEYAWFREQLCLIVCPYGRLQSVLQDDNTVMVSYDFKRGEPRGGNKKKYEAHELGDCVDCKQCVQSCPTGIDIRNGIQLECVNCTACMDACNRVMQKAGRPPGLVRYASDNMIGKGLPWRASPRSIAYSVAFILLFTVTVWQFARRPEAYVLLTRIPGPLYQKIDRASISNIYSLQIVNKSFAAETYRLQLLAPTGGRLQIHEQDIHVAGLGLGKKIFLIILPLAQARQRTPVSVAIFVGERQIHQVTSNFYGPEN